MSRETAYVLWFDELKREDVDIVGGKSSSLGELTSSTNVPVPYGFATTAYGYRQFMTETGLEAKIKEALDNLDDVDNSALLREVCANIRQMICDAEMPKALADAIRTSYEELGKKVGEENPFVAVRSSATAEDLPDASFAGQQDTYLNVRGADVIIQKVKECYASTFTDRATYYRVKQGFDHMAVALSAAIQMMVYSKAAGVMFTVDLVTGNDNNILIEGAYGLGEYVVGGIVTPDNFRVDKTKMEITDRMINDKNIRLVRKADGDTLQARPETVWSRKDKSEVVETTATTTDREIVVKGLPASPGKAAGKAHVILDPADIDSFQEGEILVTTMTAPDWVPVMKKAKAIVTDAGGMTCHASIVSRELGIPCIVGTKSRSQEATVSIKDGQMITVDASNGIVYDGILEDAVKASEAPAAAAQATEYIPVTGTKIYMNLGNPDMAEKYGVLPCDGIGLMREEFIWTTFIHEHPLHLIETGRGDVAVNTLAEGMRKVCEALAPRQVVVRLSDFKSSEYRDLNGGDKFEPHESSALLGWRGASRYYDPKYLPAFKLELEAIKKVRNEFGFKNLQVMIPFCRTVDEARLVTNLMAQEGLARSKDFKIWMMAEIPSNIILADQFNQFVDGYSIGSNDLTMLVLGCDRDNETVQHIYDERNLAVRRAVRHLIEVAHKDGKTVSICGQAPSVYPEFCEFLIKSGIDSISVNPDAVKATKKMAAQIEQRMMMDALTGRGRQETEELEW